MIQANELRIGNWAYGKMYPFRPLQIKTIHETIVHLGEHLEDYEGLLPIPLTPEILEKCGFISNPYQDRYEFGNIYVEYCAIRNICWIENKPHIQYLHQLQNYVYVNTNIELNYQL